MDADAFGSLVTIAAILLGVLLIVFFAGSLVWVYRDAETRGKTGCLWVLLLWFTWPFGLVAYLLLRDREVRL